MQTIIKEVKRQDFLNALSAADRICKAHPRTKLAWYCEQFLDLNKKISKKHNKDVKDVPAVFNRELMKFTIESAIEKEGEIQKDDKGYKLSKANEIAVMNKQEEISKKIEEAIDEFMENTIEVKCILGQFDIKFIPKDLPYDLEKFINGYVFHNKSEFFEEITQVSDIPKSIIKTLTPADNNEKTK